MQQTNHTLLLQSQRVVLATMAAALLALLALLPVRVLAAQIPMMSDNESLAAAPPVNAPGGQLAASWACANGPRLERFAQAVVLISASSGYSFKAKCNAIYDQYLGVDKRPDGRLVPRPANPGNLRPGALAVVFRHPVDGVKFIAWYDSQLDNQGYAIYSGGFETHGSLIRLWYGEFAENAMHAMAGLEFFERHLLSGSQSLWDLYNPSNPAVFQIDEEGCSFEPNFFCGGSHFIRDGDLAYSISLQDMGNLDADELYIRFGFSHLEGPSTWSRISEIAGITFFAYIAGYQIGIALSLSGPATAALTSGLGTFANGLFNGEDLDDALLRGLAAAATAYVGRFVLDQFGDPTGLVGVSGLGCPTGDQCWSMQLAGNLPPIQHLAELHDPFIAWSTQAFGSIGTNPWYLAVTIPPFAIPGCAASPSCVTAGAMLIEEAELI